MGLQGLLITEVEFVERSSLRAWIYDVRGVAWSWLKGHSYPYSLPVSFGAHKEVSASFDQPVSSAGGCCADRK